MACQEGSLDDLKAMEEAGALEVNRRDREEGDTPISVACRWGHLPVAEWLHSRGAALDSPNGAGEAPIHEAAIHGSPELIAWLLSALGPAAASEIERRARGRAWEARGCGACLGRVSDMSLGAPREG